MATLVIINGVTGAIGGACLARFGRETEVVIYGLSRQAKAWGKFCNEGLLPAKTLICSIGDISNTEDCNRFVEAIDYSLYEKVIYVHAVGLYPFEINAKGEIGVTHDEDRDGIDDRVMQLSYTAFFAMTDALREKCSNLHVLIFGGLADQHRPAVHQSWWKTLEKVRERMQEVVSERDGISFYILNISSVLCPSELISRPFVFTGTDADPRYWLAPHEVAEGIFDLITQSTGAGDGFVTTDLFLHADYFHTDFYRNDLFSERKKGELGIGTS